MAIGLGNNNRHFRSHSSVCKIGITMYSQRAKEGKGKDACHYLSAPSILGITMGPRFVCGQGLKVRNMFALFVQFLSLRWVFREAMKLFSIGKHWETNLSQLLEAG